MLNEPRLKDADPLADSLLASIYEEVPEPSQTRMDATQEPLLGAVIENYEITFVLGRGGFATVYKARDTKLGRNVAIKFLHDFIDPKHEGLLLSEAQAIAALGKHPHIVQIYTWGEYQSRNYFVLEFVGSNAAMLVQHYPNGLPPNQALRIAAECADGLAYAHNQKVLHRDIKPANILLELDGGHAKLADFGVAKWLGKEDQDNNIVGTASYMAPEIARGGAATVSSDLYSLGATLYELLSGQLPYMGSTIQDILGQVIWHSPVPLRERRPDLSPEIIALAERCMARDPGRRFTDAAQLARELRAILARRLSETSQALATPPGNQSPIQILTSETVRMAPECAPAVDEVLRQQVNEERILAAMSAQAAKRAGARKLAEVLLNAGARSFQLADANERKGMQQDALEGYRQAKEQFDAARSRAEKYLIMLNALRSAQQAMESARSVAEEDGAESYATGLFTNAREAEDQARQCQRIGQGKALYEKAAALYQQASAQARQSGKNMLALARANAETALAKAITMAADCYAPEMLEEGESAFLRGDGSMLSQPEEAAKSFADAQRIYATAIRETILRKRRDEESARHSPMVFLGIEFAWVPAGRFTMGCDNLLAAERPAHEVHIRRGFWLSRNPITQGQWKHHMGRNPAGFPGDKDRPVENITWEMCQEFLRVLSAKGEGTFRLPSEAEWEYACRAGSTGLYFFGDDPALLPDYAWTPDTAGGRTHPLGAKLPNPWGFVEMQGNVSEWCQDNWRPDHKGAWPDNRPWLTPGDRRRVVRGGSWCVVTKDCRTTARSFYSEQDSAFDFVGFRVVRNPD